MARMFEETGTEDGVVSFAVDRLMCLLWSR